MTADMTTPTPHGAPELTNIDLAKAHGADICDEWDIVDKTEREQISFTTAQLDAYTSAAIEQAQSKHKGEIMNNEQAKAAALSWHGEAGGELLPQLTANELAGIVNEAIQQAAGAVPEGMVLVPEVPTHEMLSVLTGEWHPSRHQEMKLRWPVMLAASPSPLGREAGKEGSSDHLAACAGGGATQPLTEAVIEQIAYQTDSADDLMAMADLVKAVAGAKTNGGALSAIATYRKATRIGAIKRVLEAQTAGQINPGSAPLEDGHG